MRNGRISTRRSAKTCVERSIEPRLPRGALPAALVALSFCILTAAFAAPAPGQIADSAPDDLARWGLHCFCIDATATPQRPVRLDTNGKLLRRAVRGASIAAVRAEGLEVSDSQIALLRAYRLVRVDGDRITTAFPVLGPEVVTDVRRRSSLLGKEIASEIRPQVRAIRTELTRQGLNSSDYAVVFGYALDGLLWDRLRSTDALPETALTVQEPFWRGAFWAVYPERSGGAGRNEITLRGAKLATVWTDPAADRLNRFLNGPAARAALAEIASSPGRPDLSPTLRRPNRSPAFPIIRARIGDPLYEASASIAATVAAALVGDRGADLRRMVPDATSQEAILIVAHELIWDVAAALVTEGELDVPPVLQSGDVEAPLAPALFAIVTEQER